MMRKVWESLPLDLTRCFDCRQNIENCTIVRLRSRIVTDLITFCERKLM